MAGVQIDPSHIVTSPWKDVPYVPDTDIYTFMFNREAVGNYPPARDPNRIAFIDAPSGTKITYRELKERIENLSRGMSSRMGIKAGDTICFYLPNHVCISAVQFNLLDRLSNSPLGGATDGCDPFLR